LIDSGLEGGAGPRPLSYLYSVSYEAFCFICLGVYVN
jgi:hypothetical protein